MAAPQVTAGDRLGFTLFLALAVHGVLLFGVGFAVGVPCLAIAIGLSALVKIVGCALWPGYVACGWLRTGRRS